MLYEVITNIENNITADTVFIKKIRINFAEYAELLRHPYLNKAADWRSKKAKIASVNLKVDPISRRFTINVRNNFV